MMNNTPRNEQQVIDEALSAIADYKKRQAAGIPDITVEQFIGELRDDFKKEKDLEIKNKSQASLTNLYTQIVQLNRRLNVVAYMDASYELEILKAAITNKQMTLDQIEKFDKQINDIDKQLSQNSFSVQKIETELAKIRKDSKAMIDQQQQEYNQQWNQPSPGGSGNDTRNRPLINLLNQTIRTLENRERELEALTDQRIQLNESTDLLNKQLLDLQRKKFQLDLELSKAIDSPFIVNERFRNVVKQFVDTDNHRIKVMIYNDHILSFVRRNFQRIYLVTNFDFDLCSTFQRRYPKLFINWENMLPNRNQINQFIQRMKFNQSSVYQEYKDIENRYCSNRDDVNPGRIILLPSMHMISDHAVRNGMRLFFIDDGIRHDWYDYNQFYHDHYSRSIKFNRYHVFFDIEVICEISRIQNLNIEYDP